MNCLFYDYKLQTTIPCILIPGELYRDYKPWRIILYLHVYFDPTQSNIYPVTQDQFNRYSSEFVNIHDLYPANTPEQISYYNSVIPNLFTNNTDELNRFMALISMIVNTGLGDIPADLFFGLCQFISYELLFNLCTLSDREFLLGISTVILTDQPPNIPVPQIIQMYKTMCNAYSPYTTITDWYIENYNSYQQCYGVLPIHLNIPYFTQNCFFIQID